MAHTCPWWFGYLLLNPIRRVAQRPSRILEPFVREGMLVVEPGCGMGFFTLDLIRIVGRDETGVPQSLSSAAGHRFSR